MTLTRSHSVRRLAGLAAGLVALTVATTACQPAVGPGALSGSPVPGFEPPAAPEQCTAADLSLELRGPAEGPQWKLVYRNTSSRPCTVVGVPRVTFFTDTYDSPGGAFGRSDGYDTVTIEPGATVSALFTRENLNPDTKPCAEPFPFTRIVVEVPGSPAFGNDVHEVAFSGTTCKTLDPGWTIRSFR